ncbi:MAG: hypothetical protein KBH81_10925 [Phycisphaerae bacterium]|nr:hypothetical protein [Phycisphaerae bacterium]HOO15485.1 hypothetical protein [Phycisphaerae bacterium]HPC20887.1 hypothetical protein [Phycisphaerae bacterium]HRS27225.1 hypothetical protein [Phycisphaerae bacterium]HRT40918.1 hypothetical protein [Phycisphaerae bacterium]
MYLDMALNFGAAVSDHATILACTDLAGTGVTLFNNYACWTGTRESLQLAARRGMQVPDCPTGVILGSPARVAHNDAGQFTFGAVLRGTGVTVLNDGGRWMFDPGAGLIKIAREGDPIPWFGGGQSWKVIGGSLGTINVWSDG